MNGSSSSSSSAGGSAAPPPPAVTSLAPGFRFHPTDEELVSYYLKRKVLGRPLRVDAIAEVDLYKLEPWDLPQRSLLRSRDAEWYFFSPLDRKHSNRARTNRATAGGYWKTTGKDREVRHGARVVGMKKTLVFHAGRAPRGERTNWVMHEYRLEGEESAQAGIPQDSYVVCRIFQKSGPGPQNGAQYGAPFVEEEWENEEEEGLLPVERDGGEDKIVVGAQENGYLQMNDLFQDFGGQNESGTLPAPVFNVPNNSNYSADVDVNLGDLLNDPNSLDDVFQYIDQTVEQNSSVLNANLEENAGVADFSHNSCQNDGYLELKDFADAAYLGCPSSDASTNWPSDVWPPTLPISQEPVNEADGRSRTQELCNGGLPDINGQYTFQQDELQQLSHSIQENSQMNPHARNPPFCGTINSVKPEDDGLMFFDAAIDPAISDDDLRQLNEFLYSPFTDLSGVDMVDDLERYYDAMNDNLFSDVLGSVQQPEGIYSCAPDRSNVTQEVNNTTYTYSATQKALEPNVLFGASSSARLPEASQLNFRNDFVVVPDAQSKNNSIGKQFVNILDSISAPPAFAAEFPPCSLKSSAPISGTRPDAIHLSAEMIRIGSVTLAAGAENWSLQKNEDLDLLIATGFEPNMKMNCGCNAVAMVLRGGFCLFFLSAFMLLVSYGVGMCVYSK